MSNLEKGTRVFVLSAGLLLLAAAMVRFIIATTHSQILCLPDPLLAVPIRYAVLGIGCAELVVGLICLFGKSVGTQIFLLTWLMTNWAIYQAGLFYGGRNIRCTCLGILTDPLRLSRTMMGEVTEFLPVYLFVGTCFAMAMVWIQRRSRPKRKLLKVVCPGCGGHIAFPAEGVGWKITCPHCGGGVRLKNLPQIA